MKYMPNVRKAMTPRSAVLFAVALLGTGWAATAYWRRQKNASEEPAATETNDLIGA